MTSAIPAWKAELQRRRKEKLNKDPDGIKDKKKWMDDFNEPVNVIIISATDIDPDKLNDDDDNNDPFTNHHEDNSKEKSNTRGVSEEHTSSVKNNPFLKFDQLITSRSGSPTRPTFLRRQSSGSLSSFRDGHPEGMNSFESHKSRSKSVDNLSFHQQHRDTESDEDRLQGKGLIASLRARFGKAASADEFLALMKKPRSKSNASYSVEEAEKSKAKKEKPTVSYNSSRAGVSQDSRKVEDRPDNQKKDPQDHVSNTVSSKETNRSKASSLSSQSLSAPKDQAPKEPSSGKQSTVKDFPKDTNSDLAYRQEDAAKTPKKETSKLSASALISLDGGSSLQDPKRPPSVVGGGEEFHPVLQRSSEVTDKEDGNHKESKDETDSIGKLRPAVTVGRSGEKHAKETKDVEKLGGGTHQESQSIPHKVIGNDKVGNLTGVTGDNSNLKSERTQEPLTDKESIPSKKLVTNIKEPIEDKPIAPIKTGSVQKVNVESIKSASPKSELPKSELSSKKENDNDKMKMTAPGNKVDKTQDGGTSASQAKVTVSGSKSSYSSTPKQSSISTSNSLPKTVESSDNQGDSQASPFAIKLRKVEKPASSGIKVVRSSKGNSINKKSAPKRDVKTVLKEQMNGEIIPVTNIDDIDLEENGKMEPAEIMKVNFEVIGFNTKTSRSSLVKGGTRKNRNKVQLRFNDKNVQTHEYQSEESALRDYIAEHGEEPEEEISMATENGDDEEDEVDGDITVGTKKEKMNNNTSMFSQGLQNITKSNNMDLSSFLGRGPHKKEDPRPTRPTHRPSPVQNHEPEVIATPLDDGDGFSSGSSSAMLF